MWPRPQLSQGVDINMKGSVMVMNAKHHRIWLCFLFAATAASLAAEARADANIGVASVVRNDVTGVVVSGTVKVNIGASVFSDEIMKTAKDSSAKLVFTDSTNLAIGPNSTVKLNHFVFAGPSNYGKATINVAKGAFRFTTGHSDKGAYEISTGVGTLGVRGTIFEGVAGPGQIKIHVLEGAVDIRTSNGKIWDVEAGQSVSCTATACTPISNFDLNFPSELTEIQEFSQVQAGEQGIFASESPVIYLAPAAVAVTGATAGAWSVSAGSPPNNFGQQEKSLWLLSHKKSSGGGGGVGGVSP